MFRQSASSQGAAAGKFVSGMSYGTAWMDVEEPPNWPGSASTNAQWLHDFINAATGAGLHSPGIYASASMWSEIMGSDTSFSNLPLWYAHYDNNPSFSDFQPFGGWTQPTAKQYQGNVNGCGTEGYDENYFGGSSTTQTSSSSGSSGASSKSGGPSSGSGPSSGASKTSSGTHSASSHSASSHSASSHSASSHSASSHYASSHASTYASSHQYSTGPYGSSHSGSSEYGSTGSGSSGPSTGNGSYGPYGSSGGQSYSGSNSYGGSTGRSQSSSTYRG